MTPAEAKTENDKAKDEENNPGKGYRTQKEIDAGNKQDVERTRKEAAEGA